MAQSPELQVYFEDANLIVLEKPAGLLSQGEHTGDDNLVDRLRARFGRNYVGLVHRLDRNTSGIMVVAKRSKAAQRLTESLQKDLIQRTYLAWVHGQITGPANWRHWLLKDERTNVVKAFRRKEAGAKEASLTLEPKGKGAWNGLELTLIELRLETGRSHQIRTQAAAEGHPLLGDVKYARGLAPPAAARSAEFGRPALHSHRIRFPHPIGGTELSFESPLPPDFAGIPINANPNASG